MCLTRTGRVQMIFKANNSWVHQGFLNQSEWRETLVEQVSVKKITSPSQRSVWFVGCGLWLGFSLFTFHFSLLNNFQTLPTPHSPLPCFLFSPFQRNLPRSSLRSHTKFWVLDGSPFEFTASSFEIWSDMIEVREYLPSSSFHHSHLIRGGTLR